MPDTVELLPGVNIAGKFGLDQTTPGTTNGVYVNASPRVTITQAVVAVTATSGQLIAANPNRKFLKFLNVGTNPVTVVPGVSAAVAGTGMVYNANIGQEFDGTVSTDAFQIVCGATLTSTVIVWEGV